MEQSFILPLNEKILRIGKIIVLRQPLPYLNYEPDFLSIQNFILFPFEIMHGFDDLFDDSSILHTVVLIQVKVARK